MTETSFDRDTCRMTTPSFGGRSCGTHSHICLSTKTIPAGHLALLHKEPVTARSVQRIVSTGLAVTQVLAVTHSHGLRGDTRSAVSSFQACSRRLTSTTNQYLCL